VRLATLALGQFGTVRIGGCIEILSIHWATDPQILVLDNAGKLDPLAILVPGTLLAGLLLEGLEGVDLSFQFLNCPRRRGEVEHLFLGLLYLIGVIELLDLARTDAEPIIVILDPRDEGIESRIAGDAPDLAGLLQLLLEALAAAGEREVDRLGRRGEPAL